MKRATVGRCGKDGADVPILEDGLGGVDAKRGVPSVRGGVTNLKRMPRAENLSGEFELLCGLFGGHKVMRFWLDRRGDSGLHEGRCV